VSGSGIAAIAQYTTLVHWLASLKYTSTQRLQWHAVALLNPFWPPRLSISAAHTSVESVNEFRYRDDYRTTTLTATRSLTLAACASMCLNARSQVSCTARCSDGACARIPTSDSTSSSYCCLRSMISGVQRVQRWCARRLDVSCSTHKKTRSRLTWASYSTLHHEIGRSMDRHTAPA
jgi:hypothetical protein